MAAQVPLRIGCVIMAAGNARRYGKNKLAAEFQGKPLIQHTLEAVPQEAFSSITVVSQYPEILALARSCQFHAVCNPHPDWGISHTIRLGLTPLLHCDGVLFQVSDQPLLQKGSILKLVECFAQHPEHIAALAHNGVHGNPCLFPARFFPELLQLQEDHGGNQIIRRHPDALVLCEAPPEELTDVDTPEALRKLQAQAEQDHHFLE